MKILNVNFRGKRLTFNGTLKVYPKRLLIVAIAAAIIFIVWKVL